MTIHQLLPTLSPALLPFLSLSAASWKRQHPQWEYRQWTLQEVRELMWHEYPTLTRTASDGMLAIAARYFILCREGGLYADADVECARPFDDLMTEGRLCLAESPDTCGDGRLTDTLMLAGQQEHPFLRFVLDRMEQEPELLEKPGNTLLTLLYEEFEDKETVTLLPASAVMPCTEDEMELYRRGKLAEDEMRQRTEGARSLCYYRLDRRPPARPVGSEKTEIAYVSTTAGGVGGAFQAGLRIHLGLRSIGLHSTMLVLQSGLSAEENRRHDIRPVRRMTGQPCGYGAAMRPLKAYPNYDMGSHGFDPAETGVNLVEDIEALNPRLVILHGVNGGLASIETLGRIRRKLVWRLPDCWAFTGGCYYPGGCTRYLTGCGRCPKLGSDDPDDLSYRVWQRKADAWRQLDMTVVVPTLWMKRLAAESPLLAGRETVVIPNGLDLSLYRPADRRLARRALRLPQDRKIILFGAINAFDPRKGFAYLVEALRQLSGRHKDEYGLAVFGMGGHDLGLDIPVHFLGYLRDPYLLRLAYAAADVMAVPSLEEAFGQTVSEAMACGIPVVSFLETGPESIVRHLHSGYLARYKDSADLAQGIEWVLADDGRTATLAHNARRQAVEQYDMRIVARQYESLYHRLTGR